MGRSLSPLILLALGALAATGLAACGEEDAELLPGSTASEITANLDTVRQLSDEGDCIGAESAAQQVSEQIEAVEGIDARLKQALREGATRLNEVVSECEETTESVEPAEVPTTEEEPEKPKKEKKPKEPKEKPKEDEGVTPPGPPEETPASPETPATPPGQEEADDGEAPSGGVGPGSAVGEGD